ncbi:hypothetical protein BJX96DRAFT_102944 [Aspergillus floccosus]
MTSYLLNCPSSMTESCYFPPEGYTLAQGPSSFRWIYSSIGYFASQDCEILATTAISCVATMIEGDSTQVSKDAVTTDRLPYHRVTITATETQDGAATTATASATTKGAPSVSSATATATGPTTAAASATGANATGGTSAATTHTTSHNAAMAWATGPPVQWVVGGAAMGVIMAMV